MLEFKDVVDKVESVAGNLARSFGHAALQSPIEGATQLINHIARHELIPRAHIVDAPHPVQYRSAEWYAQQIGNGAGIAFDFIALSLLCKGVARGGVRLAESTGLSALAADSRLARMACAMKPTSPVTRALIGGAAYEGIFQPVQPGEGNFWLSRFDHAAVGGLTFGTLALSNKYLGKLASPARATTLGAVLASRPVIGMISGVPVGLMSAEATSILTGRGAATKEELERSVVSFVTVGGALGLVHEGAARFAKGKPAMDKPSEQPAIDDSKPNRDGQADEDWVQFVRGKLKEKGSDQGKSTKELVAAGAQMGADMSRANLAGKDLAGLQAPVAKLEGADLQGSILARCHMWLANLIGAKLNSANLRDGMLRSTRVESAEFRNANLENADLDSSSAVNADFRGANCRGAKFTHTDLTGADFTGADVTGADFTGANLEGVKGLNLSTSGR
ncbi:MAG: pentapeptide repeat-containing protein [Candidatus Eremiobacteraeota bacterium]|nr:pentapeptide repeat-containing protein [Candidatus Eremiobacteraeota bacterium]